MEQARGVLLDASVATELLDLVRLVDRYLGVAVNPGVAGQAWWKDEATDLISRLRAISTDLNDAGAVGTSGDYQAAVLAQ